MSRGLGKTQRAIVDYLEARPFVAVHIEDLALSIKGETDWRNMRSVQEAVRRLRKVGVVETGRDYSTWAPFPKGMKRKGYKLPKFSVWLAGQTPVEASRPRCPTCGQRVSVVQ